VDDHRLFADAIRVTVSEMGMSVLGVYATAESGLAGAREHHPDMVLLDLGLPDRPGLDLGREILDEMPGTKVVALTALEDEKSIQDAHKAGFHGYLTKQTEAGRFRRALQSVEDGQTVFPSPPAGRNRGRSADQLLAEQLTAREVEVLQLLAEGASSGRISEQLGVSPNTVRTHVQGILSKLQVHSRLEAAAFAVRLGLVDPRP
jgi:two-component system, NarL family, nitrate/nitrite response regulator NarL